MLTQIESLKALRNKTSKEIPALQGAMAWGETPEETLHSLLAVTQTIIQLRREEGEALPPEITPLRSLKGTLTVAA